LSPRNGNVGIIHRRYEILDIASVEWSDKGPPQRGEDLARDLVGLVLELGYLTAALRDVIAALE
jgi:hypothetical protein